MANPVNWFEIYVDDMERAKAFYGKVFQVEFTNLPGSDESGEMWAFPMDPEGANASGSLIKHPEGGPGMGGTMVYFACDDVSNELGRVSDAGGKVLHDKFSIGEYGFIGMIQDTEGNMIGVHSQK
ncbi:MAG: VOC family protein [Acidobacteria bacterium]|nr:MAG: VOC family protein [Acidobacteriota bacterium]REJ98162.1 MAG: VOC family protein [Acidobacteriota bacterium]REK16905.1 MAG: VOC family protein [Acidobacteriota bacterium]REK42816.1 MAG: VOC family protein [Acidobacteriota bacterium]